MGLAARFERLVPDLSATFIRFPVPALFSIALCIYLNLEGASSDADGQVIAGAAAAFFAAGAAHLFAEGWKIKRTPAIVLAIAAASLAGVLGYFTRVFNTNLLFLFAGLLPLLMISPYLRRDATQGAIWLFNLRFGLAALLAFVVALLFGAGLSAIVEALNILFDAGLGDLHEHIWYAAMSLIAPLYGLSLMPRELHEEIDVAVHRGSLLDRGISVLVNYIAVPVIIVYALILHAYAVKIILDGGLPKGQIGTMVSIFAIGGTATWLVAWPWRDAGTKLLRFFIRGWFFLLVVPAILLTLAIWRRLSDYGVTPDRYGIALVAIWVAALAAYLAVRRNRADMRAILGAMAVLLLAGSVGPIGANGLTVSSQFGRLVALLQANGVLKDGKIAPAGKLPADVSSTGYSIIYALKDADGLYRLEPWFDGDADDPFADNDRRSWAMAQALTERLGFSYANSPPDYINFSANRPMSVDVPAGAKLIGPFQAIQRRDVNTPQLPMTAVFDKTALNILLEGRNVTVPLNVLMAHVKARRSADQSVQPAISFEVSPDISMVIDQAYGSLANTPPVNTLRFWLILPPQL